MSVRARVVVGGASLVWTLFAIGCTRSRDAAPDATAISPIALDGAEWIVVSLNGKPLIGGSYITLKFADTTYGGYGGCNWFGGRYTAKRDSLQLAGADGTLRGCMEPASVMRQEEELHRSLQQVATHRLVDERLEMRNRAGDLIVVASARVPSPMKPADLVGTSWRLRAVNDTIQPADSQLTLKVMETGISGFAGCRDYTGTYQARGDDIGVTSISMSATECEKGDAALLREGRFTTDLSEASHYRIAGDTLEIVTAPGRRLRFTARP